MDSRYAEPCPKCGTRHRAVNFKLRPEEGNSYRPDHVKCVCGATLFYAVPIFKTNESGWVWRVLEEVDHEKK